MKKLLLLMALWSLPAFSAESLPGEHGDTSAAEARRKLVDAQEEQQQAQKKLKEEQDQERTREEALQQAQQAAKAHPADSAAQQTVAADQSDLTIVEGQVAAQEAVVTADSQDVTDAQAIAIQAAAKGTQTIPGSGPASSMLDQPVTIADLESEIVANKKLQEKFAKELTELSGIFTEEAAEEEAHLEAILKNAQQIGARLSNASDFLRFISDQGSAVQFTNQEIDTIFFNGNFLPSTILSPDTTTLKALSQKSLATQFYAVKDGLDALALMKSDGTLIVHGEPVLLFVGDDAAVKGELLKNFLVDCQKKLIDPLLAKTTTLSELVNFRKDFPADSSLKVFERARAVVTDILNDMSSMADTLNRLLATPGYDQKEVFALASKLANFPNQDQFPEGLLGDYKAVARPEEGDYLGTANAAFPELKSELNSVSTFFEDILWDYSSFSDFLNMQTLTLDNLSNIINKGLFCKFLKTSLSTSAESVTHLAALDALTRADTKDLTFAQRSFASAVAKQYTTFLAVQAQAESALASKDFIAMEKAQDLFRSLYEDVCGTSSRAQSNKTISGMAKDFTSIMRNRINAILEKYSDAVDSFFSRVVQDKKGALYSFKQFFKSSTYTFEKSAADDDGLNLYDFENAAINDYVNEAVSVLMFGDLKDQPRVGDEQVALQAIAACGGTISAKDAKKWLSPQKIPLTVDILSEEDAMKLAQSNGASKQLGLFFTPETYQYVLDAYNTGKNVPVDSKGAQKVLDEINKRLKAGT